MYVRSIDLPVNKKQWEFELERFKGKEIFCPMCEVWHEDNSLCQVPAMERSHDIF
jgi:hypothetical protein